jgi:hypothetical protein
MYHRALRAMLVSSVFLIATTSPAGSFISGSSSTLVSATNNNNIQIHISDTGLNPPVNMTYGYAGVINWSQNGGANTYASFCIELQQDVYFGSTYNYTKASLQSAPSPNGPGSGSGQPTGGMGTAKANAIAQLWAQYYPTLGNGSTDASQEMAAGFQLAIWRIEYDLGDTSNNSTLANLTTGNFTALDDTSTKTLADAAITDAENMLAWLVANPNAVAANDLWALTDSGFQDQVTEIPNPEPTSLALAAVGGVMLAGANYFRRKKRQLIG